jgi:hypothetical protein
VGRVEERRGSFHTILSSYPLRSEITAAFNDFLVELRGIELTTSQAHCEDDIGSLTAINMTLPALLVMVSFGSGLGQK